MKCGCIKQNVTAGCGGVGGVWGHKPAAEDFFFSSNKSAFLASVNLTMRQWAHHTDYLSSHSHTRVQNFNMVTTCDKDVLQKNEDITIISLVILFCQPKRSGDLQVIEALFSTWHRFLWDVWIRKKYFSYFSIHILNSFQAFYLKNKRLEKSIHRTRHKGYMSRKKGIITMDIK